jgi:hypothetical protein
VFNMQTKVVRAEDNLKIGIPIELITTILFF